MGFDKHPHANGRIEMTVHTDSPALWSSAYRPNKAAARGCPLGRTGHLLPPRQHSGRQQDARQPGTSSPHPAAREGTNKPGTVRKTECSANTGPHSDRP